MKPEISAVAQRQSAKPSGAKTGATSRPIMASRLSLLEATTFSRASKL
ncbi:unknown [Firmicutes bacterium CAG:170]|nr:unknown [Firmicutes bacterium CAG:170]